MTDAIATRGHTIDKVANNSPARRPVVTLAEGAARIIINEQGRIVSASSGFAKLANLPTDRLVGQDATALLSFAYPAEALSADQLITEGIHRAAVSGIGIVLQFDRVTTPQGRSYLIGAEVSTAGSNADPQVARLLAGHRGPDGNRETEGDFREFLDMSNDLLAVSSRDAVFLRVNLPLIHVLGYSDAELRRMSFMDLIHPDDRAPVRAQLVRLMHEEGMEDQIIDFETRCVAKDGSVLRTAWRQKRRKGLLYSVGRDVTGTREYEATLRRKEQQLGEAEALGHSGHWRWVVGAEEIEWSDGLYSIAGLERDSFRPTLDNLRAVMVDEDGAAMLEAFDRAIAEHANYEMDCRIKKANGEIAVLHCEGKCEEDENGEVIALFGVMQDITMRMKVEGDLLNAKESAERAYAAKSQFLANMSHELRTPLNAIIGFSEMMQKQVLGPIGTPRYLDYVAGIHESGEHLLDLISDILDMSKIEAGKYDLHCETFDAARLLHLAAHMMQARAQEGGVKLLVATEADEMKMTADRRAIMQVVLNLLSNALKFTEEKGSVSLSCATEGDMIRIMVQDTGIGIPPGKIADITRPFEQAANQYTRGARRGGTGLGLSITKELIELHKGRMQIESTEGVGTNVTFWLPVDGRACPVT